LYPTGERVIRTLRRINPYLVRHKWAVLFGLLCVAATNVVALIVPRILRTAVDSLSAGVDYGQLSQYALLIVAVAVVAGVFRFAARRLVIGASREIEYELRNDYFRHLQKQTLSYFRSVRVGDLMARATNDLNAVRMYAGPALLHLSNAMVGVVAALVFMLALDASLTLWAVAPLAILPFYVRVIIRKIHDRFEDLQEQFGTISTFVQEHLSGIRVVKAYVREQQRLRAFRDHNRDYVDRARRLIRLDAMFFPSMFAIVAVGFLVVLGRGGYQVVNGTLTLGGLIAMNAYLGMLIWPMIAFGWTMNLISRASASMGRIAKVMGDEPDIFDDEPEPVASLHGRIEFRGLSYAYADGHRALTDINLHVPAGGTLAVVGRTGSGKTTLASLIPRLLDPPPGSLFVDGIDVRDVPIEVLRRSIGVVPQETFLFSVSVRDNVTFGAPDASDDDVFGALTIADLDTRAEGLPDGLETMVGERGVTLSGGQKQRLAIGRAIIRDPAIMILDDCLSSVDTQTEDRILSGLRGVMRARTTIIIAHRVSTVKDADEIVVLDDGRIVERGDHDTLVRLGGIYAEMARIQQLQDELEALDTEDVETTAEET
jgi:ATP-binding cassette subfamily B multidrug efflux pump